MSAGNRLFSAAALVLAGLLASSAQAASIGMQTENPGGGAANLFAAEPAKAPGGPSAGKAPGPIADFPIWIELDKPQLVTVVIEDAAGVRVRNLVGEMQLPAGRNRLSWDGYDDGTRNAAGDLVRHRVAPGTYRARGLTQDGIKLIYEFTAYSGGNPPWPTKDNTGAWLADHSVSLGALFLPADSGSPYGGGAAQVLLTSLVAEAGAPFVWAGLDGQTLQRRHMWGWDGAIAAARDAGKTGNPDIYAYLIIAWEKKITIRGLTKNGDGTDVLSFEPVKAGPREPGHDGYSLAVRDGLIVFNSVTDEVLIFADARTRKVLGTVPMVKPRGLQFDSAGRLLVISDGKVLRFSVMRPAPKADGTSATPELKDRTVLIDGGLEDPRTLAFNPACSELYVADWGKSHQVKVFTPEGKALRQFGKANDGAQVGLYDELKMQAPLGLAIDDKGQLWVAEAAHLPKRVSLWNAKSGVFKSAHYGPPGYGGGGTIDPTDKSRLYYAAYVGLMEFSLDWKAGTSKPYAINVNGWAGGTSLVEKYGVEYGSDKVGGPSRWGFVDERPTQVNGRTYIMPSWQAGLRDNGHNTVWLIGDDRIAWPVSRVGGCGVWWWPPQLNQNLEKALPKTPPMWEQAIAWSDLNGNHKVDSNEYSFRDMSAKWQDSTGKTNTVRHFVQESYSPDLSMTANWGMHVPAPTFDAKGIPIYDLSKAEYLVPPHLMFEFDEQFKWGQQVMKMGDGWVVASPTLTGWKDRKLTWSYPTGSGEAPPARGGDVVQPTRLLGPPAKAPTGDAGYWFALNGEKGNIFLMTSDGLFLQTLGGDMRTTPLLRYPKAERGMVIDSPEKHISFEDEHFRPTVTTTDKGEIYLVAGKEHSSIFRVDGFESVKRRNFDQVVIDEAAVAKLPAQYVIAARKQASNLLKVALGGPEAVVDGNLAEYTQWASLGVGREASVRIGEKHLYAAWRTGDKDCLVNGGGDYRFLFKRGGCVDLRIESNTGAAPGPVRLLVTTVKGETKAVLYKPVVPGTAEKDRVLFESPIGSVWFDAVLDVSKQVKLAQVGGDVEISVPLDVLGVKPVAGRQLSADLGLLRGDGAQTVQRLYWNNLDTLLVSDIPSEARLQSGNWGRFRFVSDRKDGDGSVRLAPEKAKRGTKQMQLKTIDAAEGEYAIGFWSDPADALEWSDLPVKPGIYEVELTYACGNTKGNEFVFASGQQSLKGKTTSTGAWNNFTTVNLGKITLAADKASFTFKAISADQGLMDFQELRLVPIGQ